MRTKKPRRRTPAAFYTIAAKTTCKTTVCCLPQSFFDTAKACTDGKSVKSFSPSFLSPALTLPLIYDIISKSVIKIFGWYTVPEVIDNVIQS